MTENILEMKGISKAFPGVQALDKVQLTVRKGTVHALMGENGAGKSTLMKCLFGVYHKDEGTIIFDGEEVDFTNAKEALEKGVAMIHQELQPIPMMTIGENVFLGNYPMKGFMVDHDKMYEETEKYLKAVDLDVSPKTLLKELTVSKMQLVEIAKALSHHAKILIMDEPTSSLTSGEVETLFGIIERLKAQGVAIIYISHKMDEILRISDDVTIMRDGQYVSTDLAKDLTTDMIIAKMVGRELDSMFPPREDHTQDDIILKVENATSPHPLSFKDCSFELKRGEILGVGGLVGAQRTELMEAIYGMRMMTGKITVKGKEVEIHSPKDAIANGLALVTEDRRGNGIFGVLSVSDNVAIAAIDKYIKGGLIDDEAVKQVVDKSIDAMNIKTPSRKAHVQNLSGGNQQKVILSRWLANDPDILILDEPTRGIDVGAKYEIYQIIGDMVADGKSVIMITSEMSELLGVSDRVMVMCEGRVVGFLDAKTTTQEEVMTLATKFK